MNKILIGLPISDLQLLLAVSRRIDELSALDRLIQPEEFRLVRDLLVDIMEGYEHGLSTFMRRRVSRPRREFEWSRSQGFVAANSEPGREYGVDLLAFYRSQPNGNHLAATITRVRGFIRPVFEANTLPSGMPAFASRTSTRTRSTSRTSLSTGQTRIGSPGSRRLSSLRLRQWMSRRSASSTGVSALWPLCGPLRPQGRTCGTTICLSV